MANILKRAIDKVPVLNPRDRLTAQGEAIEAEKATVADALAHAEQSFGDAMLAHDLEPIAVNAKAVSEAKAALLQAQARQDEVLIKHRAWLKQCKDFASKNADGNRNSQIRTVEKHLEARRSAAERIAKLLPQIVAATVDYLEHSATAAQQVPDFPHWGHSHRSQAMQLVRNEIYRASVPLILAGGGDIGSEKLAFPGAECPPGNFKLDPAGIKPLAEVLKESDEAVLKWLRDAPNPHPVFPIKGTEPEATVEPAPQEQPATDPIKPVTNDYSNWIPPKTAVQLPKI